jgi:K+-transporting ATPase KdpF subunit
MDFVTGLVLALAVLLMGYLMVSLLYPEKF